MKGKEQPASDPAFRNRLLSLITHDIRQPLGMLKSFAMLLHSDYHPTQEGITKMVESLEHSADASLQIFDNGLQWIKWQLEGCPYQPEALLLKALMDDTLQDWEDRDHISIQNTIDTALTIHGDEQLLLFIHRNLIHHALVFSSGKAIITISAEQAEQETVVRIEAKNSNLSAEKANDLFYFKADQSYSNDAEKNAAIAFMICNDFMQQMDGHIRAESTGEQGVAFCYTITSNQ